MDQYRGLYTGTLPRYRLYPSPLKFPSMTQSLSSLTEEAEPWSVRGVLSDQFMDLVEEVRGLVQLTESCRGIIIYTIDQGSPCPLATLNPFGRELLLSDVSIGIKWSTWIERSTYT